MAGGINERLAAAFVAGARRASPKLRERAMRGPIRRLITAQLFAGMARRFDGERGADLDTTVRWEIGSAQRPAAETWDLVLRDGRARAVRVAGTEPSAAQTTIGLDRPTLLELAVGNLNGPQAYLSGRLRMTGDVMLAQRLTTLITVPGAAPPSAGHGSG
jgi:alkyl sulfatase BDS1-like metallo-beta-lactamase superfamily hydrolase